MIAARVVIRSRTRQPGHVRESHAQRGRRSVRIRWVTHRTPRFNDRLLGLGAADDVSIVCRTRRTIGGRTPPPISSRDKDKDDQRQVVARTTRGIHVSNTALRETNDNRGNWLLTDDRPRNWPIGQFADGLSCGSVIRALEVTLKRRRPGTGLPQRRQSALGRIGPAAFLPFPEVR